MDDLGVTGIYFLGMKNTRSALLSLESSHIRPEIATLCSRPIPSCSMISD
jgi:hypothetical protein